MIIFQKTRFIWCAALLFALGLLVSSQAPVLAANLVSNGSFETLSGGNPA
ncbi:MAG: hypothetical protein K0R67_2797, partial [Paenibacillus sp.]|nr:hypothetical protein [Paenibacillus sp.]